MKHTHDFIAMRVCFSVFLSLLLFAMPSCDEDEPIIPASTASVTLSVEGVAQETATLVAEVGAGSQGLDLVFEYFRDGKLQKPETVTVGGQRRKSLKKN